MAYYNYKRVRDLRPDRYTTDEHFQAKHRSTYDGGADYDGDDWIATADYIEDLQEEIRRLAEIVGVQPRADLLPSH